MKTGIFHPKFIFHHRNSLSTSHLARVLIERITDRGAYNFATGAVDGGVYEAIYQGTARITKVAFPTNRDIPEDAAKLQRMRVAIGFDDNELVPGSFNVNVNDRITVLTNASDPEKVGTVYYVHGDESSSNAWERVLTAQTNMKQA